MSSPINNSSPSSVLRSLSPKNISNPLDPLFSSTESAQTASLMFATNFIPDYSSSKLNLFRANARIEINAYSTTEMSTPPTRLTTLRSNENHFSEETVADVNENKQLGELENDNIVEYGTQSLEDGAFYEGELRGGLPHGRGTLTSPEGWVYEGDFFEGQKQGHGVIKHATYGTYIGHMVKNEPHGYGSLTSTNGSSYTGEIIKHKSHGYGHHIAYNEDAIYIGEYIGEWIEGSKNGCGTETLANGEIYVGEFSDNSRQGHGTVIWPDNGSYTGHWENSEMQGHGIQTYSNGDVFSGTFIDSKMDGYGSYISKDGELCVGECKSGKFHGYAKKTFKNGSTYEGYFFAGMLQGFGIKRDQDGHITHQGEWFNDEFIQDAPVPLNFDQERIAVNAKISEVNHLCSAAKESTKTIYSETIKKYQKIKPQKNADGVGIIINKTERHMAPEFLELIGQYLVKPLFSSEKEKEFSTLLDILPEPSSKEESTPTCV